MNAKGRAVLLLFVVVASAVAVGVAVGPFLRPGVPLAWIWVRVVLYLAIFGFVYGFLRAIARRLWAKFLTLGESDERAP